MLHDFVQFVLQPSQFCGLVYATKIVALFNLYRAPQKAAGCFLSEFFRF